MDNTINLMSYIKGNIFNINTLRHDINNRLESEHTNIFLYIPYKSRPNDVWLALTALHSEASNNEMFKALTRSTITLNYQAGYIDDFSFYLSIKHNTCIRKYEIIEGCYFSKRILDGIYYYDIDNSIDNDK